MLNSTIYDMNEDAVNSIPGLLVLLILSPDYLFNFAYLNLVWQLYSFYFDGFASNMLKMFWEGKGTFNVIIISFGLFACQIVLSILFALKILPADNLVLAITVINFVLPSLAVLSVFYL